MLYHRGNGTLTIKGVLLRFTFTYVPLLILSGIVMNYFGLRSDFFISIFILYGCAQGACITFAKKNNRDLTKNEKVIVFWRFFLIALLLELILLAIVIWQFPSRFNINSFKVTDIFLLITIVVLFCAAPIYIAVGIHKKSRLPNEL